jgi:hypothetical protein
LGTHNMADNSATTLRASFVTRAATDLAVEHLVQQMGISPADIFIQSTTSDNTVGAAPSGGATSHDHRARDDAPLSGEIELSVDVAESDVAGVQRSFGEAGAIYATEQ